MNLPPEFILTITNTFGGEGTQFLAAFPRLVEEASRRWDLTNIQPVPNLSYNFVAFATSPLIPLPKEDGNVVVKIGVPHDELTSEIEALRLFNGEGACQLLDADDGKGLLLLERLQPGAMLSTLEDDEEATRIAAETMKRMWRPLESDSLSRLTAKSASNTVGDLLPSLRMTSADKFIRLTDWFDGLKRLRTLFNGGTGPLDKNLVERAESSVRDFFSENHTPVLLHGDFHHYNVLSSERGWLVIDPKGVVGPACYEVGPLMMNPWESLSDGDRLKVQLKRRVDILHEHLGFERERIIEWSLAHAVLSAWWGIEDNTGWDDAVRFAEMMAFL